MGRRPFAVVVALAQGGLARDLGPVEPATAQTLQHLATWTATLALHLLASVLSWTSGAVNPLVYSLLNTRYKQAFRRTLCMAKVCGSSVSLTSSPSEDSGLSFLAGGKVAPHPVQLQSLHTLSLLASRPCSPLQTSVLPSRGPRL